MNELSREQIERIRADKYPWGKLVSIVGHKDIDDVTRQLCDLALAALSAEGMVRVPGDKLWSFLRAVLEQGVAIGQDYHHGKYPTYEHYAARMDEAARERVEELLAAQGGGEPSYDEKLDVLAGRRDG